MKVILMTLMTTMVIIMVCGGEEDGDGVNGPIFVGLTEHLRLELEATTSELTGLREEAMAMKKVSFSTGKEVLGQLCFVSHDEYLGTGHGRSYPVLIHLCQELDHRPSLEAFEVLKGQVAVMEGGEDDGCSRSAVLIERTYCDDNIHNADDQMRAR
jgi:hypothetical protein